MLSNKDFLAGLIFLAFGVAAMVIADREFPMGRLASMGPGNFPAALGVVLALFGVFLAARGLGWRKAEEPLRWDWRPVGCIVGAMVAFGFVLQRFGLIAALVAMFLIAAFAGRDLRWREVLVLTVVMTALAVGVFVVLLKLPYQLVPGFYLV